MDSLKSITAYNFIYKVVRFCLTLLYLYFLYFFGSQMWEEVKPLLSSILKDFPELFGEVADVSKSFTTEEIFEKLKQTGIIFLFLIASFIGVFLLKLIWAKLPVPGYFIKYWDNSGQVSSILGRCICSHLRGNTYFSNEEWVEIVAYAQGQQYYFYKATRSKSYADIMRKYDKSYKLDYIGDLPENINPKTVSVNKKLDVKTISTVNPVKPQASTKTNSTKREREFQEPKFENDNNIKEEDKKE